MTINQAKKIILEQIENQKSQTFLIEGSSMTFNSEF